MAGTRGFSLFQNVQTGSGVRPVFYTLMWVFTAQRGPGRKVTTQLWCRG